MQQMIDEAGNIWNVDAQGNPISLAGTAPTAAPQAGPAPFTVGTPRAPEPRAPYRFESNDGSIWEVGPDGQPRQLFQDSPAPSGDAAGGDVKANQRLANLRALQQNIARVRELYQQNLRGGAPNQLTALVPDFLNPQLGQFDSAGAGLGETGLAAFRVPGVGAQSDAELRAFIDANRPQSTDSDLKIEEKLRNLETRLNATLGAMGQSVEETGPTVLPRAAGAQADPGIGPTDVTSEGGLRYEQGLSGLPDAVANMVGQGAQASEITAFLNQQYAPFGASVGPDMAAAIGTLVQRHRADPRAPVKSLNTGWENFAMLPGRQESTMLGRAADTDVGNFVMHGANAATAGIPGYLAGDQGAAVLDASRQSRPLSSITGDIAGGIGGVLGTGGLANMAARSAIRPLSLAGQALTKGGYVGNDIAFSAARGGFENGPEGAVLGGIMGGVGNKVGTGIASGVGRGIRGISDPAVNRLAERGIPMNLSALLGNKGAAGKFATALDSLPFVGANNNARLTEGFEQVNRQIAEEAGAPIGFTPSRLGYAGAEDGLSAAANAIDNSVAGVDVPLDAQFNAELQAALARGAALPDDLSTRFNLAMQNKVNPAISGGNMTGENFSQVMRGLKGYKAETPKPGFEQDYRDALSSVQDAFRGNISRNASPDVVQNLDNANTSYRNFKLIEDAVKRARNGSRSGEMEVYTPSQMNDAISASKYAKAGTQAPFREIVEDAQRVLPPTVPNSGTADRLAAMQTLALPATIAGGGAASTIAGVSPQLSIPLTALALALSTKTGAKVAQKALTGRGPAARALGTKLINQRRKAGLFGASAGAAMLPQFSQ